MIKITKLNYGSYRSKRFVKYVAENGNYICAIDDEIISPHDGNEVFKKLQSEWDNYSIEIILLDKNNEEIISYIENGIDKYVEYIDNYNQYRIAKNKNEQLYNLISNFKSII